MKLNDTGMDQPVREHRGFQGAVLKAMRAPDFQLSVVERTDISPHYVRYTFDDGGLLQQFECYPTFWIRLWFWNGKTHQQRGYTVIEPDPDNGTFAIEFALHHGPASNWAREADVGDTLSATVAGSRFSMPDPTPQGYLLMGDTASLPAINTLLSEIGTAPTRVWLEYQQEDEQHLPLASTDSTIVQWVPRREKGAEMVSAVEMEAFPASDHFAWVACDMRTTKSLVKVLRESYALDKESIKSQAYWVDKT